MKTYKNLYNKYISKENVELAIKNAVRKKKRKDKKCVYIKMRGHVRKITLKQIADNPSAYVEAFRDYALNFKGETHHYVSIYDNTSKKKRNIVVPKFQEQVVHHMIMNILRPIFMKSLYEHSNASIPGRGTHRGAKYMCKWIKHGGKDIKYCIKGDIRKFFDSIDQNILLDKLKNIIKDARFMQVVTYVIRSVPAGLPLGFYTSHWLADFMLRDFDHGIKQTLKVPYMRYMDDIALFFSSKKKAHAAVEYIRNELLRMHLRLKANWQVFRFHYLDRSGNDRGRALDFMGFKFYRNRTTLRKSTLRDIRRKAIHIHTKGRANIHDARQMISYSGRLQSADVYGYYTRYIMNLVNFGKLKKQISAYERRLKAA